MVQMLTPNEFPFNNKIYYEMNNESLAKVLVWFRSFDAGFDFFDGFDSVREVCLSYISYYRLDFRLVFVFGSAMLNSTLF